VTTALTLEAKRSEASVSKSAAGVGVRLHTMSAWQGVRMCI
jgi:hypothetical protein